MKTRRGMTLMIVVLFLLLDEPTAGLDLGFRRELLGHLSGVLHDERKSVLFSTHVTSDLERIADYVTFIRDGEVVFSLPKDELRDGWGIVKGNGSLLTRLFESALARGSGGPPAGARRSWPTPRPPASGADREP